jgi:hypothetical protein
VGSIPAGLPNFTAGEDTIENVEKPMWWSSKVLLMLVSWSRLRLQAAGIEVIKYEIDLFPRTHWTWMANFLGGMFQAYPSYRFFPVDRQSTTGAESGIAGMITSTMVGVVLLLFDSSL